jgi:hypothetical protein
LMKKLGMVVVMLAMVAVAIVPALAQDSAGSGTVPVGEEEPVAPCETGPFTRMPGEFVVYYYSEEEMWAAPQENVVYTSAYTPSQLLYFKDIANISDPCERFAAEEAKRQEILYFWPGVQNAGYNPWQGVTPVPAAG